jgi:hypothetical protein
MEIADIFHGITMKGGITKVVPVDFKELQTWLTLNTHFLKVILIFL